jgi:S-adenosylmethionine:diacylglycerol 3-amino-3-carboxypropyl transferase
MSTKRKFNLTTINKDPIVRLRIPPEVYAELEMHANGSARSIALEVLTRLAKTLEFNEEYMGQERMMCMIFANELAHKG